MEHAKLMLDCGFTSCFSAAWPSRGSISSFATPSTPATSRDPACVRPRRVTATGGLGDVRQLLKDHTSVEIIADGADELRRVCRTIIREGVDTLKINLSGDNWIRKDIPRN